MTATICRGNLRSSGLPAVCNSGVTQVMIRLLCIAFQPSRAAAGSPEFVKFLSSNGSSLAGTRTYARMILPLLEVLRLCCSFARRVLMPPTRSIPASQFCGKIFGFTDYRFGRSIWNGCYCGRQSWPSLHAAIDCCGLLFRRGCCTLSQAFNHPNSWHPQTFFTKEMLECTSSAASDQQSARKSDQQSARKPCPTRANLEVKTTKSKLLFLF